MKQTAQRLAWLLYRIDDNGNRVPLDVAVGDRVLYSKYGGTEVKYGGEDYLVLSARDILAVVVG